MEQKTDQSKRPSIAVPMLLRWEAMLLEIVIGSGWSALEAVTWEWKVFASASAGVSILLVNLIARDHWHADRVRMLAAELAKSEASLESERNQPSAGAMRVLRAFHGVSGAMGSKEISEKISWNVGAVEYGLEELNSLNMVREVEPDRFATTMIGGGIAAWDYNQSAEGKREHAEYLKTLPR